MKSSLTEANKKFIESNRFKMSGTAMAMQIGCNRNIVTCYLRKNGLAVSKELQVKFRTLANIGKTTSTPEIDKILAEQYLQMPVKALSKKIGRSDTFVKTRLRQLALVIPIEIIEQRKLDSRIKSGHVPPNKGKKQIEYMSAEAIERTKDTRFRKGQTPVNAFTRNGVISIRHNYKRKSKPYKYIRLDLGKWYPYHQYIYEKKYGKLPRGKVLRFKDGDTLNCRLSNLEVISRKKNMELNTIHRFSPEVKKSIRLLSKLNKKIKNAQK